MENLQSWKQIGTGKFWKIRFTNIRADSRFALLKTKTHRSTCLSMGCSFWLPLKPLSAFVSLSLGAPHLLPLLIQLHNLTLHFLIHTFSQRINLRWRVSLLPRLLCISSLLSLPFLLDRHVPHVVAMRAKFRPGMFNLNHDFRTVITVLQDVWGKGAGLLGSRGFSDGFATWTDGLIDETHIYWRLRFLRAGLMLMT